MKEMRKYLKNSLIYHMSLGSKELFHSNVWAWLMEKDKDIINIFFDKEILGYEVLGVEREFKHRDIIIWLQKKEEGVIKKFYFVLENKIKSLPTVDQLKEYTVDLYNNKLIGAVYTGLVNPFGGDVSVKNEGKNGCSIVWRFIKYDYIAEKIRQIVAFSDKFNELEKGQIFEYCNTIKYIDLILTEELNRKENVLSFSVDKDKNGKDEDYVGLEDLRIKDLFVKLKGASFVDYVKKRGAELVWQVDDFKLIIAQSFHNGKATLDFRYSNKTDDNGQWLVLGVQIEESQYRIVAERNKYNSGSSCAEVYSEFENKAWFDNTFDKKRGIIFKQKTSMKCRGGVKFNKYGEKSGNYSFVYQYYDITDENNSYRQLFEAIKKDLEKAIEILKAEK